MPKGMFHHLKGCGGLFITSHSAFHLVKGKAACSGAGRNVYI